MPGHGAHKCKSTFNPAFVPKTFYGRGGRGNYRPTYGYGRGFVLRSFIGFGRGFNGQFGTRGYGFQGNLVYPDLNPFGYGSTSMFSHPRASSQSLHQPFLIARMVFLTFQQGLLTLLLLIFLHLKL